MDSKLYQVKNFNILNETYFNQLNKTPEQTARTFLHLMNMHIPSQSIKSYPYCPLHKENNSTKTETPCVSYCNEITELLKINDSKARAVLKEVMKDDSYLKMLGSLNTLTQSEIDVFYGIFRSMEKTYNKDINIHNYVKKNIKTIIAQLIKNLEVIRDNYVIIVVGKMLRKIIKDKDLLIYMLNKEVFSILYSHGKSANFILSKEISNILFYLFDNEKVCSELVAQYLEQQAGTFAELMINNLQHYECILKQNGNSCNTDSDDKYYYMKRESLILLEKIIKNPAYENFSQEFTNNVEILKLVMRLLNNKSNQIVSRALTLLNFFFLDVESKNNKIKHILYSNKSNFEIFFSKHTDLPEMEEKMNFILYELERLGNLLND